MIQYIPLALLSTFMLQFVIGAGAKEFHTSEHHIGLQELVYLHQTTYSHAKKNNLPQGAISQESISALNPQSNYSLEIIERSGERYLLAWNNSPVISDAIMEAHLKSLLVTNSNRIEGYYQNMLFWGGYSSSDDAAAYVGFISIPKPEKEIAENNLVVGIPL